MSEMVERVAKAIAGVHAAGSPPGISAQRLARAAIGEMNAQLSPLVKQLGPIADLIGSEGFFRASEHLSDLASKIDAALSEDVK